MLHVTIALVACGQVICLLELLGLRLRPPGLVFALESAVVAVAIAMAWRHAPEAADLRRWAAIGLGSWGFWGLLYFGAARFTDPPAARVFDDSILARLPLVPAFTAVYLGVHVFSVVPYCAIPETRHLRRYLLGNLLIIALSAIVWVSLPVRLDRPPLSPELSGFGAWLLHEVYATDPTTNCFPSAHCSVAVYAAIGLRFASRPIFAWGIASAAAICLSTLLTKQHYVVDVVTGAMLAALVSFAMRRAR